MLSDLKTSSVTGRLATGAKNLAIRFIPEPTDQAKLFKQKFQEMPKDHTALLLGGGDLAPTLQPSRKILSNIEDAASPALSAEKIAKLHTRKF